jgi:nitric oxide reductase subunit B
MLFFVVTFVEQHLYLIPSFFGNPVQDLQVQWKATGTLVGSFNLFVYGSVIYIGERISRDSSYGHSKIAYALFAVGLLNSFTNFAHHTYHLPQDHLVKWISFVVWIAEKRMKTVQYFDAAKLARVALNSPDSATLTSPQTS